MVPVDDGQSVGYLDSVFSNDAEAQRLLLSSSLMVVSVLSVGVGYMVGFYKLVYAVV